LRNDNAFQNIIFKLNDAKELEIERTSPGAGGYESGPAEFEAFKGSLPGECRYVVYNLRYLTMETVPRSLQKTVFITGKRHKIRRGWCALDLNPNFRVARLPAASSAKWKITYKGNAMAVKGAIQPIRKQACFVSGVFLFSHAFILVPLL
jgi:hypothetical protein